MTDADFWNKIAAKYATDPISDMDAYVETLERMQEILRPEHRVIEIGCGTGSTAITLAPRVETYLGTDIAHAMINTAKSKQSDNGPANLGFAVGDAQTIATGAHDVVLALNVFHLIDDIDGALDAIYRALPSGGLFIAKTSLIKSSPWYVRAAIPVMRLLGKAPLVNPIDAYEWTDKIERTGFSVTEILIQDGLAPRCFTVAKKP